jgi:tetratricopeptide (TPR) repeat protein
MKNPTIGQSVRAWVQPLMIPTYPVGAADPNPMFFETRNIQGANGNIYPHPFTDQLGSEKVDQTYEAIYLENEYLQLILLPEIGGRIFAGLDKTNGYDFFYRHKVIKPALIGVFGPWISGGVEFNWPQHHRPSTFDRVDYVIEAHPDGGATAWMGEHDPLNRTKGMVGICLHPGKALVEIKARLYNRTPIPQTFLWWANAGVHINEQYQVIFPPDVKYAVYHAKNPVIRYPIAKGRYLANDYGAGTDVSWWANSPQATSFFAGESKYEFFGGYDHARRAGVVHVADGGISPGKKFFTWGNGPFGHTWQKALMDDTGEYLELMAGVYTDNQPDFTWIAPYETKTFSQYWYPVQEIGPMKNANLRAAVNLEVKDGQVFVGVYAVEELPEARIVLRAKDKYIVEENVDLAPGAAFLRKISLPDETDENDLLLRVLDRQESEVIRYQPEEAREGQMADPYQPPPRPEDTASVEELYLTGLHLEQYRHVSLSPEPYWEEALRRDPGDSRSHVALGRQLFRRGLYSQAEEHFRLAIERLTMRNYNPDEGAAHYHLGLVLQHQRRFDEAYQAFNKATWTYAWVSAGCYALAQIDCRRGDFTIALEHLERALQANPQNQKARNLRSAALRRSADNEAAAEFAAETLGMDPLDHWARYELVLATADAAEADVGELSTLRKMMRGEVQTMLDIAFDYANAGLWQEASDFLAPAAASDSPYPMAAYALGYFAHQRGHADQAAGWWLRGSQADPDYCFSWRLEELAVLEAVLAHNPEDIRASYYLGNLLYDKKRYTEAVELWQKATKMEPDFAIPWRNLGLAAFNRQRDLERALACYEKAWQTNPTDPRLLLEYDQLRRRKGVSPEERLRFLEEYPEVVQQRDDLVIERISLHNRLGRPEMALRIAAGHDFHAWEGGEGRVAGQYATAHWLLGRQALEAGDATAALEHFIQGLDYPENLGVAPFEAETIYLVYYQGVAYKRLGRQAEAQAAFERVLSIWGDLLVTYYRALALRELGKEEKANALLNDLHRQALELVENGPQTSYFFAGKPSPIFEDDLKTYHRHHYLAAAGLACLGLGDLPRARHLLAQALALNPANLFTYEEVKRL